MSSKNYDSLTGRENIETGLGASATLSSLTQRIQLKYAFFLCSLPDFFIEGVKNVGTVGGNLVLYFRGR